MWSGYPLDVDVAPLDRVARWRPLFNWLLYIPLYIWSGVLRYGAYVVSFLGWFAILFTGHLPESFGNYLVAVLRYRWRTSAYLYGLTDCYPGFRMVAGYVDPGDNPAVLYSARPRSRRRISVAFRLLLVIPPAVALLFVDVAALVVLVVGWFSCLLLGRWPLGLRTFVVGWMRWSFRLSGYWLLIIDDYPPFGLKSSAPLRSGPETPDTGAWVPFPISAAPPWEQASRPARTDAAQVRPLDWSTSAEEQREVLVWRDAEEMSSWAPPSPASGTIDPGCASGPPWPRLVATGTGYSAPRLPRWPIVIGLPLFALSLVGNALPVSSHPAAGPISAGPDSGAPYVFTARDAGFTATLPGQPDRSQDNSGPVPVTIYTSSLTDHAVAVAYVALPPSATFSLDDAAAAAAASAGKDGKVVSQTMVTFQGQPAEDAVVTFAGGAAEILCVRLGSSAYLLEGVGESPSSFQDDYRNLVNTFQVSSPHAATPAQP
jgi:hypothetical protein